MNSSRSYVDIVQVQLVANKGMTHPTFIPSKFQNSSSVLGP